MTDEQFMAYKARAVADLYTLRDTLYDQCTKTIEAVERTATPDEFLAVLTDRQREQYRIWHTREDT